MTNPSAQQAHRDYVSGVLSFYHENDIQQGDPNEGIWERAHYPKPKRLGGTETIWLLKEHHAVQGVLQSEEFGVCCVHSWEKHLLSGDYLSLWKKWRTWQAREANEKRWALLSDSERSEQCNCEKANRYWKENPEERLKLVKKANRASQKARQKPVLVIDRHLGTEKIYSSPQEAAESLNLCRIHLAACARGGQKTMKKKRFEIRYV